jgi:hypothetical protein
MVLHKRPTQKILAGIICLSLAAGGLSALTLSSIAAPQQDDLAIAQSLAAMLRAGRTVISRSQTTINNPDLGDKGLDSATVLAEAVKIYQKSTGVDPKSIDPASRHGRLLRAQMDAIIAVMNANQNEINRKGIGFKGFIPAVFGRLVNEEFGKRAKGEAAMKVTAPIDLVRNRKAVPDAWESEVILAKLEKPDWPKGQAFVGETKSDNRTAFRIAVPEYYAASCLSCHGGPKGEIDVTGYPKEGGKVGDLGGVISITLYK